MMRLLAAALLLLLPALVFGGENCGSMGGLCKDRCDAGEEALEGVFVDCDDKQECCKARPDSPAIPGTPAKEPAPPPAVPRDRDAR